MIKKFKKLNYKFDINTNIDLKNIPGKIKFKFAFWDGDTEYKGNGETGNTSLWFPLDKTRGIKYIPNYNKYLNMLDNVKYFQSLHSDILPKINNIFVDGDDLFIDMQNVSFKKMKLLEWELDYVPDGDKKFIEKNIYLPPRFTTACLKFFIDNKIVPYYDWYKSSQHSDLKSNVINYKIVDFHQFIHSDKNYKLPSNGKTKSDISNIFDDGLERYEKWIKTDSNGLPKWKGKFYQQFEFDNGYIIPGYSSDDKYADCVQKMQFIPSMKVKDKNVLDLGCCQGFFSFQCALNGAKKVIGVDITEEDIMAATDINKILGVNNIQFKVGDAVKYIDKTNEKFELVILSSVLHQIYKNMEGSEKFLSNISKKTNTLYYETTLNHKLMNISVEKVYNNLRKYFKQVRMLYVYDAYSSGYRGIFLCQHS